MVVKKKRLTVDVVVSGLADKAAADAMVETLKANKGDDVIEPEAFGPCKASAVAYVSGGGEAGEGTEEAKGDDTAAAEAAGHTVRFKATFNDVESAEAFPEDKQVSFKTAIATKLAVDEATVEVKLPELVHGILTPDDVDHLKHLFDATDEDDSGSVDKKEFKVLMKQLCKESGEKPPSDRDLDAAFVEADEDNGGTVDMDEFTLLYAKVKKGEVKGLGGGGMFGFGKKKKKEGTLKRLRRGPRGGLRLRLPFPAMPRLSRPASDSHAMPLSSTRAQGRKERHHRRRGSQQPCRRGRCEGHG